MIYYILISLFIIYLIWLYFKSKNDFFSQDKKTLEENRSLLIQVLRNRKLKAYEIKNFTDAYYAFVYFPNVFSYDGATILADLDTIKGLDASAMVHDYQYQLLRNKGFWFYLKGKLKADVQFGKNMRKLGITWLVAWSRVAVLILSTPIWLIVVACKGKLFKINTFQHYSENHPNQ